jgi:predicted restriction endonuclease
VSHIVPWSESNEQERLDEENGILLSPNADALFDRHLISFTDSGELLISSVMDRIELVKLGINSNAVIPVSEGMKKYLKRHREKIK